LTHRIVAGTTIGAKYAIRGVLGVGGMATVYDAVNVDLKKEVAIKVLRDVSDASDASFGRFMSEARAAAAIAHPNVCEVYDLGALDDGTPFSPRSSQDSRPPTPRTSSTATSSPKIFSCPRRMDLG
jgi:serine/threonine protein kinase